MVLCSSVTTKNLVTLWPSRLKFVETEDDPMIKRIGIREVGMLKVCLTICNNK